jgi:hypothetical protein
VAIGANWAEIWKPVWAPVWEPTLAPETPIGDNWAPIWKQVWKPVWEVGAGGSAPTAPTSVSGSATGGTTATITWTDASSDEASFTVQIRTTAGPGAWGNAAGATNPTAANVVSFAATGLTSNTEYDVRVRASNGSGDSAYTQGASSFWTDNVGDGETGDYETYVEPSAGALRFTGYAPTIELLSGDQTIEPSTGTLRFTGYAPTIASGVEGGGKPKRRRQVAGTPYTHDDYVQWVVRTVAIVAASGALDG